MKLLLPGIRIPDPLRESDPGEIHRIKRIEFVAGKFRIQRYEIREVLDVYVGRRVGKNLRGRLVRFRLL